MLVEEVGVGVPVLGAVVHHEGRGGDGLPDGAIVYESAAGLQSSPEEGVRGAADPDPPLPRFVEHPAGVVEVYGERLLGVDGLAIPQGGQGDRGVRLRDRQVEHDLDVVGCEKVSDGPGPLHPILRGLLPSPVLVQVRARDDLHIVRGAAVLQVHVADLAASNHPDLYRRILDNVASLFVGFRFRVARHMASEQ